MCRSLNEPNLCPNPVSATLPDNAVDNQVPDQVLARRTI
jgi:hypothetical protein